MVLALGVASVAVALPEITAAADPPAVRSDLIIPPYVPPSGAAMADLDSRRRMVQERTRQMAVVALIATALAAHLLVLRSLGNDGKAHEPDRDTVVRQANAPGSAATGGANTD